MKLPQTYRYISHNLSAGYLYLPGILDHGAIQNNEARIGTKHRRSHAHE